MYEYAIQNRRGSRAPSTGRSKKPASTSLRRVDKPTVVTVLEARMRTSVDGATDSTFTNVHVDSLAEAVMAVKEHAPRAILLSTAVVQQEGLSEVAKLVTKNPSVLPVAVACSDGPVSGDLLLKLGASGVRRFLDLNGRGGWEGLRGLLDSGGGPAESRVREVLLPRVSATSRHFQSFLSELIHRAQATTSVRQLTVSLDINASALLSRFFRAGLPSPKTYLAMTRLIYASVYFEREGVSIASVARTLNFSSPQSFGRHVRMLLGLTAAEFRTEMSVSAAIEHFDDRLINRYIDALRRFNPIGYRSVPVP